MRRRASNHGRIKGMRRRRAETFRAFHAEQPAAPICPVCRKGFWPTRAVTQRNMRDVSSRHDFVPRGDGWALNVYACPAGYGWHWGYKWSGNNEQAG